jgi:DNA-binding beta-propeller fold protein YncE
MRRASAAAVGVAILTLITSAREKTYGAEFAQRLQMPVRGDEMRQPRAVHADLVTGEVFVCDTIEHRVLIFDEKGLFRFEIAGGEIFRAPVDIAVDPEGYLYVLAHFRSERGVVVLDFDGAFVRFIALSGFPSEAKEPNLVSLALAPATEHLYLLDNSNKRLWIAGLTGKISAAVDLAAGLTPKQRDRTALGRVDVYGSTVLVALPTSGQVTLFDLEGTATGDFGLKGKSPCQLGFPVAAALAADGKALVLDQQRAFFMRWDPKTNRCLKEYGGFGSAPGSLYQPSDLTLDAQGRIYVSQGFEGRVQVYESSFAAAQPEN